MKRILITALLLSASAFGQQGILAPILQGGTAAGSTHTFTKVQQVTSGSLACSPTCNVTVASTGTGHLLVVLAVSPTTATALLSSISGGGTWVVPTGANTCSRGTVAEGGVSCGYVLASTSGTTTVTLTMGVTQTYDVSFWEVSYTGAGPISVDAQNSGASTAAASPPGQALTLAGTSDAIFQNVATSSAQVTAISAPYTDFTNAGANFVGMAQTLNQSSGAAPTWTVSTGTPTGNHAAIAFM